MAVVKGKIFFKVKTKFCFYSQLNYSHPRTAIEAEILFAARVIHLRFLKLLSGKTPREQNSSGKKIGAESAVPILVYFYIILIVHKYQQSAKENCLLKRNTVPEVFPLTIGSGKTMPFEKSLFPSVHPCTLGNDEICGYHKSRFCLVSRTSVSVLKLQGDRKKLTAGTVKNVPPCTFFTYVFAEANTLLT